MELVDLAVVVMVVAVLVGVGRVLARDLSLVSRLGHVLHIYRKTFD